MIRSTVLLAAMKYMDFQQILLRLQEDNGGESYCQNIATERSCWLPARTGSTAVCIGYVEG